MTLSARKPVNTLLVCYTCTLVPDAPKILEIKPGPEPESYTSICVRWSDDTKSYDRGSPITGFVVEYRNTTDLAEVVRTRVGGGVFSKTLKGLKPSCKYNVSVSAKNAVGSSEPSSPTKTSSLSSL